MSGGCSFGCDRGADAEPQKSADQLVKCHRVICKGVGLTNGIVAGILPLFSDSPMIRQLLMPTNEAFSRIKIDAQLKDVGWSLTDGHSVRYEYHLPDKTKADYVLCNRHGHALAVVEAKRASINPVEAEKQALDYAKQVDVPFIFLANGDEVWFWEWEKEAHPRLVATFSSQEDLERATALRTLRVDPLTVPIDDKIAGRDYQKACINKLSEEITLGRRKMLVSMATGCGKTRLSISS